MTDLSRIALQTVRIRVESPDPALLTVMETVKNAEHVIIESDTVTPFLHQLHSMIPHALFLLPPETDTAGLAPVSFRIRTRHDYDRLSESTDITLEYSDAAAEELLSVIRDAASKQCRIRFRCSADFRKADNAVLDHFLSQTGSSGIPFPFDSPCQEALNGCFIDERGEVYPCAGSFQSMGNIHEKPLVEILTGSCTFEYFEKYKVKIKQPCRDCKHFPVCSGCRGRAYLFSGDAIAADPFCRRNREQRERIQCLPQGHAELFLPHRKPVLMIDELLKIENNGSESQCLIRENNPFLNNAGDLDPAALIEIAAQGMAFMDTFLNPGSFQNGLLVEILNFQYSGIPLQAGTMLLVRTWKIYDMEPWHICGFKILVNETLAAEGELKVCQVGETPGS